MLPPVALGASDVARLGRFVAGTEEEDNGRAFPRDVNAVARAVVDAELQHALPHRLAVAEVRRAKARDAGVYLFDCAEVSEASEPVVERAAAVVRLVDVDFDFDVWHANEACSLKATRGDRLGQALAVGVPGLSAAGGCSCACAGHARVGCGAVRGGWDDGAGGLDVVAAEVGEGGPAGRAACCFWAASRQLRAAVVDDGVCASKASAVPSYEPIRLTAFT